MIFLKTIVIGLSCRLLIEKEKMVLENFIYSFSTLLLSSDFLLALFNRN